MSTYNGLTLNEWLIENHQRNIDMTQYHNIEVLIMTASENDIPCVSCEEHYGPGSAGIDKSIDDTYFCYYHAKKALDKRINPIGPMEGDQNGYTRI